MTVLAVFFHQVQWLVAYVKSNVFPKPLSEKEEAEQLTRMFQGDGTARNKLIEHNLRLVAHIVKKYDNTGHEQEDLISIGTIGLIKAIENYTSDKGTKLATFAARCIENEILMTLRAAKKNRKDVSLSEPIGTDKEGNEMSLIDLLGTDPNEVHQIVESQLERNQVYKHFHVLDDREREVIAHRFGLLENSEERTQREIARALGISRSYVSRIEKRALMKLYQSIKKDAR
jgi:RNA polymerase sporulation-specific sigma factor